MEKQTQLLEKIKELQSLGVGDTARLEHIRRCIAEDKKIYYSDFQYVNHLDAREARRNIEEHSKNETAVFFCWKCGKKLLQDAKFCSFCGIEQKNRRDDNPDVVLPKKKKLEINPIKIIISKYHSYQILAVIGGFSSLLPILVATLNLERLFEIIEFYFGRDLSGYVLGFAGLGAVSSVLCILVMVLPFLIRKPKKVGKILFFSSFGILALSLLTGVLGFAIIVIAGIFALKQRPY